MKYWLNVAPVSSWEESVHIGMCGAPPKDINRHQWKRMEPNDIVLFYATKPVKGLIGWGRVIERFEDSTPIWREEKRVGCALWPLRIRIAVEFMIPQGDWKARRVKLGPNTSVQRSLMPLSETRGADLIAQLKETMEDRD